MSHHRPFSRATWNLYLFLLAVRVFIALSPGYIHPDEFFQSAEITAGHIFGIQVDIPWEYKPELPCRSILIPAITTGLPYIILRSWIGPDQDHYVTTRALFLTQRLSFVLLSLVIDWAVVQLARQIRRSPSIALLLVSSSYVTLTYHTHPFSNTTETVVLALCAVVLGKIIQKHEASMSTPVQSLTNANVSTVSEGLTVAPNSSAYSGIGSNLKPTPTILSFGLGLLFSIGIFTRITFVLYGFPLGVMFLYLNKEVSFRRGRPLLTGLSQFVQSCIPLALGLFFMSSLAIIIDSIYFRKLIIFNKTIGTPLSLSQIVTTHPMDWTNLSYKGSLTVTMLNNLKYNLDEKNLAQHGLHPRLFHLLLNFPVLFGNLAWIGVITAAKKVRARQYSSESRLVTAVVYSGICGILFLSAMPHQEARFLSPLILPLVISLSGRISKLGRKFWPLWLLVNGVMAIVFGLFHQAGVVPATELVQRQSLGFQDCKPVSSTRDHMLCLTSPSEQGTLHIEDGMSYTTHIIFYKTYLPPHHLFGYSLSAAQSHGVNLTISDWREKSYRDLLKDLDGTAAKLDRALLESVRESRGQQAVLFRKTGPIHYERTVLIAPATVDFSTEEFYEPRERFSRHANFDHVQVLLQHPRTSLYLNMFYI